MNRFKECSPNDVLRADGKLLGDLTAYLPFLRHEYGFWQQARLLESDQPLATAYYNMGEELANRCASAARATQETRIRGETVFPYSCWPDIANINATRQGALRMLGLSLLTREFLEEIGTDSHDLNEKQLACAVAKTEDTPLSLYLPDWVCCRLLGIEKPDASIGQWYAHGSLPLYAQVGEETTTQFADSTTVNLRMITPQLAPFSQDAGATLLTLPPLPPVDDWL